MFQFSLAFLAGICLLQFFATLPSLNWLSLTIAASAIFIYLKPLSHTKRRSLQGLLLGFSWCLVYAHQLTATALPANFEGKTIWAQGKIISLPQQTPFQTSFLFQVRSFQIDNKQEPSKVTLRISWRHPPSLLHVGDEWQLPLRLKKIHGTLNPGGFDYEASAFQQGISAKGYVFERETAIFKSSGHFSFLINQLREAIKRSVENNLPHSQTSPWLIALIVGERSGIPSQEWEVLRNTGTNHLMAIAGLHIGLISGFIYTLSAWAWRRKILWLLRMPAHQAAAGASLLIALLYSMLAGFSLPTQRALIMIAVFLLATLSRRKLASWQAWSLALLIVLAINPLSVLSASFWLSFTTIALIIYGVSGRLAPQGWWWKWGRTQWVITLGLLPLSLWIFSQYSLISFVANALAIPWVGFLILPLCLAAVLLIFIFPPLVKPSLLLADKSLALLWLILTYLSKLPWATWQQALPSGSFLLAAIVGVVILLAPRGYPGRCFGLLWLLPVLFVPPKAPVKGSLWFSLLDVGQGLSVVIQTEHHSLVYDAGARLGSQLDMGESVVLPFLGTQGIKRLDMLVISHGDNDHSGGAQAILKQIPVKELRTSVPQLFAGWKPAYCQAGQAWEWDGVHFKFLYPTMTLLNQGNDSSCVLQITVGSRHILLTGDIELKAEQYLVSANPQDLAADILVAPHHGSKTSGLRAFISRVHPQYVLYAIGYRNRYHFPHPFITQTYRDWGVIQYDTSSAGAIQFTLDSAHLSSPCLYRQRYKRYWRV